MYKVLDLVHQLALRLIATAENWTHTNLFSFVHTELEWMSFNVLYFLSAVQVRKVAISRTGIQNSLVYCSFLLVEMQGQPLSAP